MKKILMGVFCCLGLVSSIAFATGKEAPQNITCAQLAKMPQNIQTIVYASASGYLLGKLSTKDHKLHYDDNDFDITHRLLTQYCKANPSEKLAKIVMSKEVDTKHLKLLERNSK